MKMTAIVTKRFEELIKQGEAVLATRSRVRSSRSVVVIAPDYVDASLAEEWVTSSLSFLGRLLGKDSEHYQRFFQNAGSISDHHYAERAFAVLKAAKADYDGGYLFNIKKGIEADVFDDFLEQADYMLAQGYFQVAAVIAGAVLEDGLRRLCVINSIPISAHPKLDVINADITKAGIYDKLVQKKVTWLADIRNKAAHGQWKDFTSDDSKEMLSSVRRFMTDYL